MEIQTEFNLNETVYFMYCNKINKSIVSEIFIEKKSMEPDYEKISYKIVGIKDFLDESVLFKTKETLIEALTEDLE